MGRSCERKYSETEQRGQSRGESPRLEIERNNIQKELYTHNFILISKRLAYSVNSKVALGRATQQSLQ